MADTQSEAGDEKSAPANQGKNPKSNSSALLAKLVESGAVDKTAENAGKVFAFIGFPMPSSTSAGDK